MASVILSKQSFIYTNIENKFILSKMYLKNSTITKFHKIQ